jgi:hypothetical protein
MLLIGFAGIAFLAYRQKNKMTLNGPNTHTPRLGETAFRRSCCGHRLAERRARFADG